MSARVLDLVRAILALVKGVINSEQAKTLVLALLRALQAKAQETPTLIDDMVVRAAIMLVEQYWDVLWPVSLAGDGGCCLADEEEACDCCYTVCQALCGPAAD